MDEQEIQNAIEIAFNPSSGQLLQGRAIEFLNQLRTNPAAWPLCLSLFMRIPRLTEVVRHMSLEILNSAVQSPLLDNYNMAAIKSTLMMEHVQPIYGKARDKTIIDSLAIQNKLTQTLTLLFVALYEFHWESFFDDLRQLIVHEAQPQVSGSVGTLFYLRMLASVNDEIADAMVQIPTQKQKKYGDLKDLVRVRDANKIAQSWQEILSRWRQQEPNVTELCLKTISRWVNWTDISLFANESMLDYIFQIAVHQEPRNNYTGDSTVRDAAIDVFTEIISKKMKPNEKIELIRFLKLDSVVRQLISTPSLNSSRGTSVYDTDMAETVAKLVNVVVIDIVKVLDAALLDGNSRQQAEELLQLFIPHLLRFFSDEFDEVCSTVVPALSDLLGLIRKLSKGQNGLPSQYGDAVLPIMNAIIAKMRYDDTSAWGEEDDQTDEAEFQDLRKRLKTLQETIAVVDEKLYLESVTALVISIFSKFKTERQELDWRDLDLALHEMYYLGEFAVKNRRLYRKKQPASVASEKLINMMSLMLASDIAAFPHPAVHLQYMEICARYYSYFEYHSEYIPKVLEDFVRLAHSKHIKVRLRSWHLFLGYVRALRSQLGNVSETVVRAISDLLVVEAEVSEDFSDDDMSSNQNSQSSDARFQSQLYLFEAVGCLASASSVPAETQVMLAQSIMNPLEIGLQEHLIAAIRGEERAILQIHHITMALGTLARGFSDWTPGSSSGSPVSDSVSEIFRQPFDAILLCLGSLKSSMTVRTAARFAFARMVGVLGSKTLEQLPQWIDGFLAGNSTKEEIAIFLRLLDQVIFDFKTQISTTLDTLLTPLLQRIFAGFAEPVTGTDDENQLGELRREYLNFLLVILNNDLGSVFVSPSNQAIFEAVIVTIEHFAKDTREHPDAKLAMSVMTRMSIVWGGPDIPNPVTNTTRPSPSLPGFDRFMLTRFSSLTWTLMTSPSFSSKAPQTDRVIGEIALLQKTILAKTGHEYLSWLKEVELRNLGLHESTIEEYLGAMTGTDTKGFKQYLLRFLEPLVRNDSI